jgi:dTDP-4-amino-4,6-dideoxygalactose transaminase
MFYMVMPSFSARQRFIEHLKTLGILSVFHYIPLHLSPVGMNFGGYAGQCPITERVADCLVRLPFYNDLLETEQADIVAAIHNFEFQEVAVG